MKTCVRTDLLGFLLIIPMTTSFIEGRSPPFISPIYSPCETMEMITDQDKACTLQQYSSLLSDLLLRGAATYVVPTGTMASLMHVLNKSVTQLDKVRPWFSKRAIPKANIFGLESMIFCRNVLVHAHEAD